MNSVMMKNLQVSVIFASLLLISESTQNATSGAIAAATPLSECFSRRPVRNLVYRFEGSVTQRPGFRAGCEVQYRSYGSTGFNLDLDSEREELEPINDGLFVPPIVLKYFLINARGEEQIVSRRGTTTLEIPGESQPRNLTWDQFCFPKQCHSFVKFMHNCLHPWIPEGSETGIFLFYPVDLTLYRFGQVDRYSTSLYCQPKDHPQRVPLLTASASFPAAEIKTIHTHDNLTFDLGPHLSYTYWMTHVKNNRHFKSIGCHLRTPLETPGQVYRTFISRRRHYEKDFEDFVPTSQAVYGMNVTNVSGDVHKITNICFPARCFPDKTEASRCNASLKVDYAPTSQEIHLKYHENGYSPDLYGYDGSFNNCETRTVIVATRPYEKTNSTQPQDEEHFMCNHV